MSAPTHEERVVIWRYTIAHSSFNQARVALMYLLTHPELPEEIKQAFLYSGIICYARPFTKSHITVSERIVCLDDTVIPAPYRALHHEHITWRDKAVAHTDVCIFSDTLVNNVVVVLKPDGFELKTAGAYSLTEAGLHDTITMCDYFITHCEMQLSPYRHFFTGHKHGVYKMNFDDGDNWLTEWPMLPPTSI
jgi:hypothetical protein